MPMAPQPIITNLIPFNPARFDVGMAYLVDRIYCRPLTIFESIKHHVMAEVYHVLETGHQMIGGALSPWTYGPVVIKAYGRLDRMAHQFRERPDSQFDEYELAPGEHELFRPRARFDADDFSLSEESAMNQAVELLMGKNFDAAVAYFHGGNTFMGRAWLAAKAANRDIAWTDIIEEYDNIHQADHGLIRRRLISYG